MTRQRALLVGVLTTAVIVGAGLLFVGGPHWFNRRAATPVPAPTADTTTTSGRKIKARLFYVNDEGVRLTGVERDVAYAESASDQAREIVAAQIAPVAEPLLSAVPHGTQLRALFITDKGEAFVDLSRDVVTAHPGGSANELLTVYTLVNALTANLPAITAVQLLVDGKEVDTLAGHVDLRRPLVKNLSWVE